VGIPASEKPVGEKAESLAFADFNPVWCINVRIAICEERMMEEDERMVFAPALLEKWFNLRIVKYEN
jgi:hypothetical protein